MTVRRKVITLYTNDNGRPIGGGRFAFDLAIALRVVAIAVAAIIIESVGIVIVAVIAIVRGSVEQAAARTVIVVRPLSLSGRADVVDPGVFGEVAAGLVARRPAVFNAAAKSRGVAETLVMATTHHRADAAEQQRPADHTGSGRRRRPQERTAAAHRGLRRAVRLAVLAAILSGVLRLLHRLAAVPDRPAADVRGADIGHRARAALRLAGSED